jgi:hypothetical protein
MAARKRMTLAEHDALLRTTGQYDVMVERKQREEAARQKRAEEWRHAEAPLVEELKAVGFAVESVWDLVNTPGTYPSAVPILLDHLQRQYPAAVREGIARALAVPEAKVGWDLLTRLYCEEQQGRAKDGLAVAIAAAAEDDLLEDVIALARDTRQGPSRLLLLSALERSASPRARAALMDLGTDPELKKEIRVVLHRLKRAK